MGDAQTYWVYENWTHDYATVHKASCSHCNDGRGSHGGASTRNGRWLGPYPSEDRAMVVLRGLKRQAKKRCAYCM